MDESRHFSTRNGIDSVLGSVQHSELSLGNALQVSREPARMPSTEDPLGLAVAKAANHATEGSNRWT